MTDLEGCIRFWESTLFHNRYLLEPATIALIEMTIKFLKELQNERLQEKGLNSCREPQLE